MQKQNVQIKFFRGNLGVKLQSGDYLILND